MKVVLLGPPGAGKSTQAQFIMDKFNFLQISTGNILRSAIEKGTELGVKIKIAMDAGLLVADEIIIELVKKHIVKNDDANGFLFDGFPRTIHQAEALRNAAIRIDHVIEIIVDDEKIVQRIAGRRIHPGSSRIYHTDFNPPKIEWKDNCTGEDLIQRDDDTEDIIRKRLSIYHHHIASLVDFYKAIEMQTVYTRIEGVTDINNIKAKIINALQ